jgi:hypothetical protein
MVSRRPQPAKNSRDKNNRGGILLVFIPATLYFILYYTSSDPRQKAIIKSRGDIEPGAHHAGDGGGMGTVIPVIIEGLQGSKPRQGICLTKGRG